MDEQNFDALAEVQYLLERMLDLAVRAAEDGCSDARRAQLQKGVEFLRARIDQIVEERL